MRISGRLSEAPIKAFIFPISIRSAEATVRQAEAGKAEAVNQVRTGVAQKVHLAAEVKDWDPTTVLDKKDVRHMSRYTQLAAAAAKEALADSGLDREKEDLTRCGVIVSSGVGGIEMAESEELRCSQKGFDRASPFYG